MNKIWKDIKDYESFYEVSNFGEIRRKDAFIYNPRSKSKTSYCKGGLLRQAIDRGYGKVALCKGGILKTFRVHKLVWQAFGCQEIGSHEEIDHINRNKSDNRIENLQILSHSKNISKSFDKTKTTSIYTGVVYDRSRGKWRSEVRLNGISEFLGRFNNELDAFKAYSAATISSTI